MCLSVGGIVRAPIGLTPTVVLCDNVAVISNFDSERRGFDTLTGETTISNDRDNAIRNSIERCRQRLVQPLPIIYSGTYGVLSFNELPWALKYKSGNMWQYSLIDAV